MKAESFEYGRWDCARAAGLWIQECTGDDPLADFTAHYTTQLGAARAIKKFCGGGIMELASKICANHNWPELSSPLLAQRGDVAAVETQNGVALGVVTSTGALVPIDPVGCAQFKPESFLVAWRIG